MIELQTTNSDESPLPILAVPRAHSSASGADPRNLVDWVLENRGEAEAIMQRFGAILFRGWRFDTPQLFQTLANAFLPKLMRYCGGDSPRTRVRDEVYTSTEFASDVKLGLHNEASYLRTMPSMIFFYCEKPPSHGGRTPLADCRRICEAIDPRIVERFRSKKVMYVNNLHCGYGLGRSWQQTFETDDAAEVERRLDADGYEWEWKPDRSLRTSLVCDATKRHPVTGEECWINQAEQWHISALDPATRRALLELVDEGSLPHAACYGDGSAISELDLLEIRSAMDREERSFDWLQGDVLCCDNYLVCHGREPYVGERRILVAMG